MRPHTFLDCIPIYLILSLPCYMGERELACSTEDKFVDEYLLEVDGIYVQDVIDILEGFGLQYVEHIIADLHLFRNKENKKERVSEEFVQMIKSRTGGRVKHVEQQCLKKLMPPITERQRLGHSSRIRRSSEEQCNPLSSLGVYKAWKQGSSGKHVRIIVVDTGVDYTNLDLVKNFKKSLCYDVLSSDTECKPDGNYRDQENSHHGTRCSGLIAGEKGNGFCGDGVAYSANIGAVRIFNMHGETQDSYAAKGLIFKRDEVDIYSCSWGFQGQVYDSLGNATWTALIEGAKQGRNKKGSIYVFPSGNGGSGAHCNRNGYARNVHTITIGSVGFDGIKTRYTEMCPCVLSTVFGEGGEDVNSNLKTTENGNKSCTWLFKGSSVSAALAAGIIALALEVNNNLTSRDIQHLLVRTSESNTTLWKAQWRTNGAGHKSKVTSYFAYTCDTQNYDLITKIKSDGCKKSSNEVLKLEHVEVQISFKTKHRDELDFVLTSPMGTSSTLMNRKQKKSVQSMPDEEIKWVLMSVQFWDENPIGTWNLKIFGAFSGSTHFVEVISLSLILYGTTEMEDKGEKEVPKGRAAEIQLLSEETNITVIVLICIVLFLSFIISCSVLIYKTSLRRNRKDNEHLLAG
ncbi:hypothetical protein CHS0354_017528 [Potamilus streckersoni]|uniref:P/Homo B domain-containing protein n=1 Tax=Potamilus streckersoni TaxID=2493646 RepID=A0AAE0S7U4_9BIVA|nr:hypothetical protein CHS0354_017528 [Potamilus streckersoni]